MNITKVSNIIAVNSPALPSVKAFDEELVFPLQQQQKGTRVLDRAHTFNKDQTWVDYSCNNYCNSVVINYIFTWSTTNTDTRSICGS